MTVLYRTLHFFGSLIVRLLHRTKVIGLANVPRKQGVILASNHSSYYDPVILCASTWTPLHYLAKSELFKSRFGRIFFTAAGQIKVERGKGDREALVNAVEALKKGKWVVFFPEGTTFEGKNLGKGHTGVARVAIKAKAPVVPVAIFNTWNIFPPGKKIPKLLKAKVVYGKPLFFKEYYGRGDDKEATAEVTCKIMCEIAALMGKKYEY